MYRSQSYEILLALQKLGSKLTTEEEKFIKSYESRGMTTNLKQDNNISNIINTAKTQISKNER